MNTEKLYKELTVFCKNKGLEEREAAYLLGLFTNYAEVLRQPLVSGELNCEHDWLVDMYDHFGFPASRFCDKCSTREAI